MDNEESKTEQIQKERAGIKLELANKLKSKGFSETEINEVLNIITVAENDIQIIKDSLIGTNINPQGDPMMALNNGREKIRARQMQMQKDLNDAIIRISSKK